MGSDFGPDFVDLVVRGNNKPRLLVKGRMDLRVYLYAMVKGIIICNQIEYIYMQSYIIIRKSWKCRSGRAVPIKMSLAHNTAAAVESLPTRATVTARPAGLEAALADRQCQPEGLANQNSLAASASELSGWPLGSGQNMYV